MPHIATVRHLDEAPLSVLRWTLDAPLSERAIEIPAAGLYVQGWLLCRETPERPPCLLAREPGSALAPARHPFNSGRPDVIQRVLETTPGSHPQLRCGFALRLPCPRAGLELGFDLDGQVFWAVAITLREGTQVIDGRDGWLFLDNDTNRSVDQFTGALLLDAAAQARWRAYLAGTRELAARAGARHALLLAPSKEEVLRDRYPHERAATTVLDQVCALASPQDHLIDAARVLAAHSLPEACFKCTDTHWTDRGAMLATLALLPTLGFDASAAQRAFEADRYVVRPYAGDLGVKLMPHRSAPTEFLDAPECEVGAVFDNLLPNIGRVLVFEQPEPCFDAKLLMFGASSGYPMLKYLKRLFRRTVFVHSAAGVDESVVLHERPDALVMQSNGRFLIEPPRMNFSLRDAVFTKLREASPALRERARALAAEATADGPDAYFRQMLVEGDQ